MQEGEDDPDRLPGLELAPAGQAVEFEQGDQDDRLQEGRKKTGGGAHWMTTKRTTRRIMRGAESLAEAHLGGWMSPNRRSRFWKSMRAWRKCFFRKSGQKSGVIQISA